VVPLSVGVGGASEGRHPRADGGRAVTTTPGCQTLNPKPQTLNPKPQTPNPKP
jgi:hypothetical protein